MFETLHRASFTTDLDGVKTTHYVTKSVKLPETLEDLAELTDNMAQHGDTPFMTENVEPTVGYKQTGDEWERVYKTLPFWVAMAIEGYKLHVNSNIRPKQADAGITDEDVKAFEAAGMKPHAALIWSIGNAKTKKALKDEVLKWKAAKA
jgi:hypothetical protein